MSNEQTAPKRARRSFAPKPIELTPEDVARGDELLDRVMGRGPRPSLEAPPVDTSEVRTSEVYTGEVHTPPVYTSKVRTGPASDAPLPLPVDALASAAGEVHTGEVYTPQVYTRAVIDTRETERSVPPVIVTPQVIDTAPVRVEEKAGYLKLPNTILDNLFPRLDAFEQVVYLRLYRLIHGFQGRESVVVAYETLAHATGLSRTTAMRAVKRLQEKGLVIATRQMEGLVQTRGVEYRLTSPVYTPQVHTAPVYTPAAPMKEKQKGHEETRPVAVAPAALSVYDVRTIGARFRELHHGDGDYTPARLRADVTAAIVGQGREVDERIVDEALG